MENTKLSGWPQTCERSDEIRSLRKYYCPGGPSSLTESSLVYLLPRVGPPPPPRWRRPSCSSPRGPPPSPRPAGSSGWRRRWSRCCSNTRRGPWSGRRRTLRLKGGWKSSKTLRRACDIEQCMACVCASLQPSCTSSFSFVVSMYLLCIYLNGNSNTLIDICIPTVGNRE